LPLKFIKDEWAAYPDRVLDVAFGGSQARKEITAIVDRMRRQQAIAVQISQEGKLIKGSEVELNKLRGRVAALGGRAQKEAVSIKGRPQQPIAAPTPELEQAVRGLSTAAKETEAFAASERALALKASRPQVFTEQTANFLVRYGSLGLIGSAGAATGLALTGREGAKLALVSGVTAFTLAQAAAAMIRPTGRRLMKRLMTIVPGTRTREVTQITARLNTIIKEIEEETGPISGPPSISQLGRSIPTP